MKIHITFKDVPSHEQVKEYVEKRFRKIEKHFDRPPAIRLVLKKDNNDYVVDAEVKEGIFRAFASERAANVMAAVDEVVDEIDRQLHKKLGRVRDQKRRVDSRLTARDFTSYEDDEVEEHFDFKSVKPEVYTVEDARLLLDEKGGAIVFINQDTGKINVLHRTAKGRLELIEIDY